MNGIRCPECGSDDIEEIGCLECDVNNEIDGEPCEYCCGTGTYYECCNCGTQFSELER